jgi:excisionase family DNA binding protein
MKNLEAHLTEIAEMIAEKIAVKLAAAPTKKLLDAKETAAYIGRSVGAVQHLVARHEIPSVRVGRRIHIAVEDLDRWIAINKSE